MISTTEANVDTAALVVELKAIFAESTVIVVCRKTSEARGITSTLIGSREDGCIVATEHA